MPWGGAITTYSDRTVVIDGENVYIQGASSRANVKVTDAKYFASRRTTTTTGAAASPTSSPTDKCP